MSATSDPAPATFGARLMGILLAASIALAGLYAVLTAYAPELRDGQDGGGHALSNSAVGFSGIVALAQATGMKATLGKDSRSLPEGGLLVLTPGPGTDPKKVDALIDARRGQPGVSPVLVILPKWVTGPVDRHRGWVEQAGVLPGPAAAASVARRFGIGVAAASSAACCVTATDRSITFPTPRLLRVLEDAKPTTVLAAPDGGEVMGWSRSDDVYVLADPDLLDNAGMRDPATARAALALLAKLGADRGGIVFDVTLNGYEHTHNIAKLAFEPPFLALTLCLLAAAALAGLQTAFRFGAPRATPRAIAFGKRALVDNAAELIRSAKREPAMAVRYGQLMLDAAAATRGAPPRLAPSELAAWLDRRATGDARFEQLAEAANAAKTRDEGLAAAQALYRWKEDVTHDG
ncbi:hypothetical protein KX816_06885 [Sphingosinicellaceae bacterium]|nr:hypothetical protein KX816_06885 [Sphingosinicellaceae bacterium]